MLYNTEKSYGLISRLFHWIMSVIILSMISVGYYMKYFAPQESKATIYGMHKATGVIVFTLVLLRLTWRMINVSPKLPEDCQKWLAAASKINFIVLYTMMISMPITGLFMSLYSGFKINVYGLFTIPTFLEKNKKLAALFKELHNGFAVLFIIAISLHILVNLYHHFYKKDNILTRMIFDKTPKNE